VQQIRSLSQTTRVGSTLLGISDAVEKIGFRSPGVKLNLKKLSETPLPCILHWNKVHFVVLYKIKSTNVSPFGGNDKEKALFKIFRFCLLIVCFLGFLLQIKILFSYKTKKSRSRKAITE